MTPKAIFIIYLTILLVCSMTAMVMTGLLVAGFENHKKKPYIIGILSSILVTLITTGIAFLLKDYPFAIFWVFAIVFLFFGLCINGLMRDKLFYVNGAEGYYTLGGQFTYGAATVLFSALLFSAVEYYLIKDRDFLFYPVLISFAAYFLPLLLISTFLAARNIPPAYFPVWQYPEYAKESPDDNANERLLVIGFELAKKPTDVKNYFRARTPEDIILGDLFYFFINDYNELQSETPIQFRDTNNKSYQWWFRIKPKWYQRQRVLHPGQTMKANRVAENLVIICERL